jgi:hypothetical protein
MQARAALEAERGGKLRGAQAQATAGRGRSGGARERHDRDWRLMRSPGGFLQGDHAQAVTTDPQIILAAEVSTDSPDARLLAPMIDPTGVELQAVGIADPPGSSSRTAAIGTSRRSSRW